MEDLPEPDKDSPRQDAMQFFDEGSLGSDTGQIAREIADLWDQEGTFQSLQEKRADSPPFVIFDGPPFATGKPHYGHFLPMALKDWALRYHSMKGEKAFMRAGWDTHGLPIEALAQSDLGLSTVADINQYGIEGFSEYCRSMVLRYAEEWKATQRKLGRWIDLETPYATMDNDYIESVWWVFAELHKKGLVYEGRKVVAYSPALGTPLSNFEADQNYRDIEDTALTVSFELDDGSKMLAWTTTPWSLPSNLALAVGANICYVKVAIEGEIYVLAKERLSILGDSKYEIVEEISGSDLIGKKYRPPFGYFDDSKKTKNAFHVIGSDHVKLDAGTGIVHIAPAYGEEDFYLGETNELGLVDPIDDSGHFNSEVPELAGMHFREANNKVIEMLEQGDSLFGKEKITHSYPHCYRTDQPLMYKTVPSWFVKVTELKDRMVELNQGINWTPDHLKDGRFGNWLENARDWAVSRNRFWGAPLPIWKCEETGEVIIVGSREELHELTGQRPEDLHKASIDQVTIERDGKTFSRVPEIFDCWFESGAMPYASIHHPFEETADAPTPVPADFIAEGLDQTRGWFYTLMVLSTALYDKPAFRNVVVNGMILAEAEDGRWVKMSKRLRNYTDPNDLLDKVGADAIRFFMLGSGAARAEALKFSDEGIDNTVKKVLLPLWNIFKFFVTNANADNWKPSEEAIGEIKEGSSKSPENILDQWVLARLEASQAEVTAAYESNNLNRATRELREFITDISQWYVRTARERFWKAEDDSDKSSAYNTLYQVLTRYAQMIAPICPFISEKIYKELTKESSVHHSLWPKPNGANQNPSLIAQMDEARKVVSAGLSLRKRSDIRVRQPLREMAIVEGEGADLAIFGHIISNELNVKSLRFVKPDDPEIFEPKVLLNRAVLGRILKGELKNVISALEKGDYEIQGDTLNIAGHQLSQSEGHFKVEYVAKGKRISEEKDGYKVVLDLDIDEELRTEGLARDLIRIIQTSRKEEDFRITDRIDVEIDTSSDAIAKIVDAHREMIALAVLGTSIKVNMFTAGAEVSESTQANFSHEIDGQQFQLRIKRVMEPTLTPST